MNNSTRVSKLTLIAGSLAATVAVSSPALAEDSFPAIADQRGTHVLDRERPEDAADGLHAGSVLIYAEPELGVTYDDNVFCTQTTADGGSY